MLHRKASTAVQQLVFENKVFEITYNSSSNIRVSCTEKVVVVCVAVRRALFEFDTVSLMVPWRVEWPT